jgi:hypothetical protein
MREATIRVKRDPTSGAACCRTERMCSMPVTGRCPMRGTAD